KAQISGTLVPAYISWLKDSASENSRLGRCKPLELMDKAPLMHPVLLMKLSSDKVPNVRLAVVKALVRGCNAFRRKCRGGGGDGKILFGLLFRSPPPRRLGRKKLDITGRRQSQRLRLIKKLPQQRVLAIWRQ
uniref:DUF3453 domain-containing protein n=1 Tax=Macrostomum lignano TaxID=282301 RepID=A0A1I8JPY1_9PLAT